MENDWGEGEGEGGNHAIEATSVSSENTQLRCTINS